MTSEYDELHLVYLCALLPNCYVADYINIKFTSNCHIPTTFFLPVGSTFPDIDYNVEQ